MTIFIVWYLIGFISLNVGQYFFEQKITLGGLLGSLLLSVFGLLATFLAISVLYDHRKIKDITLFERKKK